jgi:hypothetical protein
MLWCEWEDYSRMKSNRREMKCSGANDSVACRRIEFINMLCQHLSIMRFLASIILPGIALVAFP